MIKQLYIHDDKSLIQSDNDTYSLRLKQEKTIRCSSGVVEADVQNKLVFQHVFCLKRFLILAAYALQERTVSNRSTTFSHDEFGRFLWFYLLTKKHGVCYVHCPKR